MGSFIQRWLLDGCSRPLYFLDPDASFRSFRLLSRCRSVCSTDIYSLNEHTMRRAKSSFLEIIVRRPIACRCRCSHSIRPPWRQITIKINHTRSSSLIRLSLSVFHCEESQSIGICQKYNSFRFLNGNSNSFSVFCMKWLAPTKHTRVRFH